MITVKATREGLQGKLTALGWPISDKVSFVALPSTKALNLHIRIVNPANGQSTIAEVLDVGPWDTKDDKYVFQKLTSSQANEQLGEDEPEIRPMAETGKDQFGRETNGAGIDLGEKVYKALGMTDNTQVSWEFI